MGRALSLAAGSAGWHWELGPWRAPPSPSRQPPNARTWCEITPSFREEQEDPAALSILLGWQLGAAARSRQGHLEGAGSPPGSERVALSRSCTCITPRHGAGLGSSLPALGAPGQGHPTSAAGASLCSPWPTSPGRGGARDAPGRTSHGRVPPVPWGCRCCCWPPAPAVPGVLPVPWGCRTSCCPPSPGRASQPSASRQISRSPGREHAAACSEQAETWRSPWQTVTAPGPHAASCLV